MKDYVVSFRDEVYNTTVEVNTTGDNNCVFILVTKENGENACIELHSRSVNKIKEIVDFLNNSE